MESPDIKKLIPQREPILMVDSLIESDGRSAQSVLTIRPDNIFLDEEMRMEETGLMEHIAQSASALAGYNALSEGASKPPIGYIGEIKKFSCHYRPKAGDVLHTTVRLGVEVEGVTILTAQTCVGDTVAADTQMKIFVGKE